jgi:hypothetical protein
MNMGLVEAPVPLGLAVRQEPAGRRERAVPREPAVPRERVVGPEPAVVQRVAAPRELAARRAPAALPGPAASQQAAEHREAAALWWRPEEHSEPAAPWRPAGGLAAVERVAWLALGVPCKPGALWELAAVWRVAEQLEQAESLQVVEHLVLARAKAGAVLPQAELREAVQRAGPRPVRQRQAPAAAPAA